MADTLELDTTGAPRRREIGPDPMIGRRLLHYRVLEVVGQGGMSVVYRGRDENLERDVAIKVLHPFLAKKEECRARLAREARAVARLEHANILKVFDFSGDPTTLNERGPRSYGDEHEDEGFLVCEYVPGLTLKHFADRHTLWSVPEAGAMVVLRVARALQHAHEQGVVHRDLKPENIMVREDGVLKLMDFGIAQVVDQKQLTVTGTLLGSPAHMAPESIEGYPADARSDIFSLGTVLYWLVTGSLPFEALTPHALLKTIVEAAPMPPQQRSPRVSDDIAKVIARSMAKRPDDRFRSAAEMADALEEVLAAANVSTTEEAVSEVLARPGEGLPRLSRQVRAAFLARAERLLEEGSPARALSCVGRVLAEHPHDPDAEALLEAAQAGAVHDDEPDADEVTQDGLPPAGVVAPPLVAAEEPEPSVPTPAARGRFGLGKVFLAAALVVVVSGLFVITTLVDRALPPDAPVETERATVASGGEVEEPPLTTPAANEAPPDEKAEPPRSTEESGRAPIRVPPRPVIARKPLPDIKPLEPTEPPVLRTVRVVARPYAHIFVDGKEVARNVMAWDLELPPGRHTLRFEHDHAETKTREIVVPAEGVVPEVRVSLDEAKPAFLKVRAEPPDAEVAVNGLPKGPADITLTRPILVPFEKMVAKQTFDVLVWKAGYRSRTLTPELEAGQTTELRVVLEPERDAEVRSDDGRRKPIEPAVPEGQERDLEP